MFKNASGSKAHEWTGHASCGVTNKGQYSLFHFNLMARITVRQLCEGESMRLLGCKFSRVGPLMFCLLQNVRRSLG